MRNATLPQEAETPEDKIKALLGLVIQRKFEFMDAQQHWEETRDNLTDAQQRMDKAGGAFEEALKLWHDDAENYFVFPKRE